jgi:hypothetical protein
MQLNGGAQAQFHVDVCIRIFFLRCLADTDAMGKTIDISNEKNPALHDPKLDQRMKQARLIRDGMSWRQACSRSGYSASVADRGPRAYIDGGEGHRKPGVAKDFERAASETVWKPEYLKKIVTHLLATTVLEGKPSNVEREAELIGRMKDVDLIVRNSDIQVGIFGVLTTSEAGQPLNPAGRTIETYNE